MTAKKKTTATVAAKDSAATADQAARAVENEASAARETAPQTAPAEIAPATEFSPSGAPEQVVPDVDPGHPAVDADPRANTSETQNRIDFNDPTISGQEAVERNLGMK